MKKMAKILPFNKYFYYENSVQTPEEHVKIFDRMFWDIRRKPALSLREDFCGTFLISCAWVKSDAKRSAVGLDLDPEPLSHGKKYSYQGMRASERKRVKILKQDVRKVTGKKFDIIGVGNFSFNIFKDRKTLKSYFKAAYQSLSREGIFVLELAGGPGFIKPGREQRTYQVDGLGRYTYYWDQKSFDPITHFAHYAIHFKTPDGVMHRDCFRYDWRIWSIPELRDLVLESGFRDAVVYWEELGKHGNGTGEYIRHEEGDNAFSWIAFVVGIK
jgi:hypothetical protein